MELTGLHPGLSGTVEIVVGEEHTAPHVGSGRVRVLAIASPQRLSGVFADVPTWKELGIDATVDAFRAMAGPRNLGAAQVAFWESAMRRMTETAEWKQLLEQRSWLDRYANAEGCKTAFKVQYDQMHAGLQELGLAKQ